MSRAIVVVPCFNEAERLDVDRFLQYARRHGDVQFLMVNDGSRDDTLVALSGLHDSAPDQFSVCNLPHNVGKAEAVRQGFIEAFRRQPDYVGFWDADLATSLDEIEPFCDVLDKQPQVEIVIGTRVPLLGRKIERTPPRRLLGRVFSGVASCVLGFSIYDTQCGAKMFRAAPSVEALFEQPFCTRWIFDVEIFARLIRNRRISGEAPAADVIYELPLAAWLEIGGSKVKSTDFIKAIFELAVIWQRNLLGLGRLAKKLAPTPDADPIPFPKQPDKRAA